MVPGSTFTYGSNFIKVTVKPRASRIAPTDAAATPLPREDTTPPVMKMYLVAMVNSPQVSLSSPRPPLPATARPDLGARTWRRALAIVAIVAIVLSRQASGSRPEQPLDALEVLPRVHAGQARAGQQQHADRHPMLEGPQLLEPLASLQGRRWQIGQPQEGGTLVAVDAQVAQRRRGAGADVFRGRRRRARRRVPRIGYHNPAEVQGISVQAHYL